MAAVTVSSRGSLLRRPGKMAAALGAFAAAMVRPVRAPLANLASVPLHAAGLACIDAGVFTVSLAAGLIVAGLSLVWLEHVIADER